VGCLKLPDGTGWGRVLLRCVHPVHVTNDSKVQYYGFFQPKSIITQIDGPLVQEVTQKAIKVGQMNARGLQEMAQETVRASCQTKTR
jgi:hypothetical protein